ncbi:hypothetical protein V6N12_031313 [Hibiscus sabdariffa]|uniref:DUF4005 domain-containing protein n=1 Tax=Hibiscus sabdariffa TaxID=183260 RepID=A0ABR2E8K7_9ROSI
MGKKRCWFSWVKKIFASDAKPTPEKKSRWKWIFGRLKQKQYHPALPAPHKSLCQATEEQRKLALNVAIATAAAAEAAISAAQAAVEVVRLTAAYKPCHHFTAMDRNLAALKIQSAFRAHLAKKALRALKGLVKLQAIVRGQAVRRQSMINRKCLQSVTKLHPKVKEKSTCSTRLTCQESKRKRNLMHKNELQEDIKYEWNSQKSWNDSVLSKDDIEAKLLRSKEAMAKRERMKKYSYSNRERINTDMLHEFVHVKETGRSSFVDSEANAEANQRERVTISKPNMLSNLSTLEVHGPPHFRFRHMKKQDTFPFPRRSFCSWQQGPAGDEGSTLNSPAFPTYGCNRICKSKGKVNEQTKATGKFYG